VVLQVQEQLQGVDLTPTAHVVGALEVDLHALLVERLQHERQPACDGLLALLVLAIAGRGDQTEAGDRRAADAVADRQLATILAVDAFVGPLVTLLTLLQRQHGRDRLRRRGVEIQRRRLGHRELREPDRTGPLARRILRPQGQRQHERHTAGPSHGGSSHRRCM
jgi:hypothetical protein